MMVSQHCDSHTTSFCLCNQLASLTVLASDVGGQFFCAGQSLVLCSVNEALSLAISNASGCWIEQPLAVQTSIHEEGNGPTDIGFDPSSSVCVWKAPGVANGTETD